MNDDAQPENLTEEQSREVKESLKRYWRTNLGILAVLLFIWAVASLGCGILLADTLNQYRFFGTGYPLGFWFAHQGSIIIFVLLILIYCVVMNKLDDKHHDELMKIKNGNGGAK